jgi:hypothetical protein
MTDKITAGVPSWMSALTPDVEPRQAQAEVWRLKAERHSEAEEQRWREDTALRSKFGPIADARAAEIGRDALALVLKKGIEPNADEVWMILPKGDYTVPMIVGDFNYGIRHYPEVQLDATGRIKGWELGLHQEPHCDECGLGYPRVHLLPRRSSEPERHTHSSLLSWVVGNWMISKGIFDQ